MIATLAAIFRSRAWDIAARVIGASCLTFLDAAAYSAILATLRRLHAFGIDTATVFALMAHVCLFLLLLVETTLIVCRPRAIAKAIGIQPRVSALLGTWLMLLVVLFPIRTDLPAPLYVAAAGLGTLGDILAIYVVLHLGGSFSFMAEARRLVDRGPYAIVRHPLYVASEVGLTSAAITHLSWGVMVLFVTHAAFQFLRARNEERVLARSFAGYEAYLRRTPMLLPRLRRHRESKA
jgi:protein-S-isoprenylcysteine O-methyltransferase Ste14